MFLLVIPTPSHIKEPPENPGRFSPLITGDVVHNLKSALDHLFTEATAHTTLGDADKMFPFSKQRPEDKTAKARLDAIEQALPGAKRLILDKLQPYEGGNHNLNGVHRLDRIDKHNELILTAAAGLVGNFIVRCDGKIWIAARALP